MLPAPGPPPQANPQASNLCPALKPRRLIAASDKNAPESAGYRARRKGGQWSSRRLTRRCLDFLSMGRTAAAYVDYMTASNAQGAANTVYGDLVAELGTNMNTFVGDLPSMTATTLINLQFVSTVQNLSSCTGSSGDVYLETIVLP